MKNLWTNVPIPEAYVAGLLLGGALHVLAPRPIRRDRRPRGAGLALLSGGLLLIGWAVAAARDVTIDHPARLVTHGPYALGRNPMYVGWALVSVGLGLLANSHWLLAASAAAGLYLHLREIPGEEALLLAQFGEEYRRYRRHTRRYV